MKRIDKRVLDIEKADFTTKFNHEQALRMNVVKRILDTPDEKFDLITSNCVRLKINDYITIILSELNTDAEIVIYQNGFIVNSFICEEPYIPVYRRGLKEEEKQNSNCELLRNKIKGIREIKLKVTEESKKYMSAKTKRFYAVFDAISGDFE